MNRELQRIMMRFLSNSMNSCEFDNAKLVCEVHTFCVIVKLITGESDKAARTSLEAQTRPRKSPSKRNSTIRERKRENIRHTARSNEFTAIEEGARM